MVLKPNLPITVNFIKLRISLHMKGKEVDFALYTQGDGFHVTTRQLCRRKRVLNFLGLNINIASTKSSESASSTKSLPLD
jgi:hypothetical protein